MNRDIRLRELSRDHHHALVLARFIEAMCVRDCIEEDAIAIVRERFTAEIAPHLLVVEDMLLAALEGLGVDDLVARTRTEPACEERLDDDVLDRIAQARFSASDEGA